MENRSKNYVGSKLPQENKVNTVPSDEATKQPETGKQRTLKAITRDIKRELKTYDQSSLKLGELLSEAKVKNGEYGNWEKWLNDNFKMSLTTARRLMRIADGVSNQPILADLGSSKIDIVLRLPKEERPAFIKENNIESISVQDLENLVKSRKDEIKTRMSSCEMTGLSKRKAQGLHKQVASLESRIGELIESFANNPNSPDVFDSAQRLQQICLNIMDRYSLIDKVFRLHDEQV